MIKSAKLILLISIATVICGCSLQLFSRKATIFVVDTSGSMRKDDLFGRVKNSVKAIAAEQEPGDSLYLITFDASASLVHEMKFTKKDEGRTEDLGNFFNALDNIEAKGRWTNLLGAMEYALNLASDLSTKEGVTHVRFILYTDGINDPPPELKDATKALNFDELFSTFFPEKNTKYPWFIYFVELDKVDPELLKGLSTRDEFKVIDKNQMSLGAQFLSDVDPNSQKRLAAFIALAISFVILLLALNRLLGGGVIIPDKFLGTGSFDVIQIRRRRFFATHKGIELKVERKGGKYSQGGEGAKIRVDLLGRIFIDATEAAGVALDGEPVNGSRRLRFGDRIQVGSEAFLFAKSVPRDS